MQKLVKTYKNGDRYIIFGNLWFAWVEKINGQWRQVYGISYKKHAIKIKII